MCIVLLSKSSQPFQTLLIKNLFKNKLQTLNNQTNSSLQAKYCRPKQLNTGLVQSVSQICTSSLTYGGLV